MSRVAEWAVLALERVDGRYGVSRSRWGGSDRAIAAVCAGESPTALPDTSWEPADDAPNFHSLVNRLDHLSTAALYRVERDGNVTVFLPLWFGLPLAAVSASPRIGALVAVDSLLDVRALRRLFRELKGRLADGIRAADVPVAVAPLVLSGAIAGLRDRERYVSVLSGTAEGFSPGTGPDHP